MAMPTVVSADVASLPAGNKRRRTEVIDLVSSDDEDASYEMPATAPSDQQFVEQSQSHLDENDTAAVEENSGEEDEDDSASFVDDILDQLEMDPYVHGGGMGISTERADELLTELRRVGVATFIEDATKVKGLNTRQIGLLVGLDPNLDVGEDLYLRLLSRSVSRALIKRRKLKAYNTIDDVAKLLKSCKSILVITGAGISTSLGIPDFRSKGTGFYEKIRQLGYEEPEEVFDIEEFDNNPRIFYSLAGEILPDLKQFTPTHAFIRLLQDQGRLQTNYTQNIDNLEALAGIDPNRLIQCHGSFATATCRKCGYKVKGTEIFDDIRAKRVAHCKRCEQNMRSLKPLRPQKRAKSRSKGRYSSNDDDSEADDDIPQPGVMKPDITFFGEQLPEKFFDRFSQRDAQRADLVIVIGTSLKVAPVSEIPNSISHAIPHIYISREPIRHVEFDVQLIGKSDDIVVELCRRAGWTLEHEMIAPDFATRLVPMEESGHIWSVKPKHREILANHLKPTDVEQEGQTDGDIKPLHARQNGNTRASNEMITTPHESPSP